ncbi:MAG: hypothetical protein OEY23_14465, partial [Acidimicrobiia bacterium]|nr:hypothetical protein [Acidimicrobiia bacterium]
ADLDLAGQSFNGLAASGGSWFGILALLASAFVALSAIKAILRPAVGSRWLAADGPARATVLASRITNLTSQARRTGVIVNDGLGAEGAGLARWTIALGVLGALLALPAAGAGGAREHRRWAFSAAVGGIGLGVTAVGLAWAISITRVAEGDIVSGAGTLLTLIGGFLVFASSRALLALFGRGKVYDDDDLTVMGTDAPSVEPGPSVLDAELDVSKVGAGR